MSYFPYLGAIPAHITDEVLAQQSHDIRQQVHKTEKQVHWTKEQVHNNKQYDILEVQNPSYHSSQKHTCNWHVKEALINFIGNHKKEDLTNLSKPSEYLPETKTQLTINNRKFLVEPDENTGNLKATHYWGTGIFSICIKCAFYCFFRNRIKSINFSQKLLQLYLNDPHIQSYFRYILDNYEIFEHANSECSQQRLSLCVTALKAHLRDYLQGDTTNLKPLHVNYVWESLSVGPYNEYYYSE